MWNFLLAIGTGAAIGKTGTARRVIRPLVLLFAIGIVVAGLIYAIAVFKAVSERSESLHVHAHSTR